MMSIEERLSSYVHDLEAAEPVGVANPVAIAPRSSFDRRRAWALAAVAVLVVAGLVALTGRGDDVPTGSGGGAGAFSFATDRVTLDATDYTIDVNGQHFSPTGSGVATNSDPGWSTYTTLELEWTEHGVDMRTNFYFTLTDTEWWVNEIRTYNGKTGTDADWVYYYGEFFRSPIGTTFSGDFDETGKADDGSSGHLHIGGLTLSVATSTKQPPDGALPGVTTLPPGGDVVLPTSTVPALMPDSEQWYTVAAPMTLDDLSRKFAVEVASIVAFNGWSDGAAHQAAPGDTVRIPSGGLVVGSAVRPYGTFDIGGATTPVGVGLTNDLSGLCLLTVDQIGGCDGLPLTTPRFYGVWVGSDQPGSVVVYGFADADLTVTLVDGQGKELATAPPAQVYGGRRAFAFSAPTGVKARVVARDAAGAEAAALDITD